MAGQTISYYEVLEKIGEGGLGQVYLAEGETFDKRIKKGPVPVDDGLQITRQMAEGGKVHLAFLHKITF
jgi:serine/threonine protein kinase